MANSYETTPRVFEAASLFVDAEATGSMLAAQGEIDSPEYLNIIAGRQLRNLDKRTKPLQGIRVVYSGDGFVPIADDEGNIVTAYGRVNNSVGYLNEIYICNQADVRYVQPGQVFISDEDRFESNGDLMSAQEHALFDFRNKLQDAPNGFRLFVEFVVRHETEIDQPLSGHAVRTPEILVYNIMDAASLEIVDIDEPDATDIFKECYIPNALQAFSNHYRQQIQKKGFRNLSINRQKSTIDQFLEKCNAMLDLSRFTMETHAEVLFTPSTDTELPSVKHGFETTVSYLPFVADCLRYDCVEAAVLNSAGLPIRKRKGNFNSNVSTCVVVEVDDDTREFLGVDSNIIWVPVTNQLDLMEFASSEIV